MQPSTRGQRRQQEELRRLRRGVLAVSVLFDVDVVPAGAMDGAFILAGRPPVVVDAAECRRALADADPEEECGRLRLARWLLGRRQLADAAAAGRSLADLARPVGFPVTHPLHPGADWVRSRVLGGALDLGLGFVGLDPRDPDAVAALPVGVLEGADATGTDAAVCWADAADYLEAMGELAVERRRRRPGDVLRPMGDCDVLTLLGARTFRAALAAEHGGLCPVAVPMRRRGWTDLRRIDPAFCGAAARATDLPAQGFDRPVLLTVDEVTVVPRNGRPDLLELRDPAPGRHPAHRLG